MRSAASAATGALASSRKAEFAEDEAALRSAKASLGELREQLAMAATFIKGFVGHMEQMCSDYNDLGERRCCGACCAYHIAYMCLEGEGCRLGCGAHAADVPRLT